MDIVLTDSEMPFLTLTNDICIMELHRMVGLIGVTIDQTAMGIKRSEDQWAIPDHLEASPWPNLRNTACCRIDWPELKPDHQTLIREGFVGCNGDQKIRRSVSNPKLPLPCQIWEILHAAELIGPDRRPSDFDWVRQHRGLQCNGDQKIRRSVKGSAAKATIHLETR